MLRARTSSVLALVGLGALAAKGPRALGALVGLGALVACERPAPAPASPSAADPFGALAPAVSAPSSAVAVPVAVAPADLAIEPSQITVHGARAMGVPADQSGGADVADKRSGPNDLFLVPLARALPAVPDAGAPLVIVDVDDGTTYRMLIEVLFTLGQSGIARWTLRRRGHAEGITIVAPKAASAMALAPLPVSMIATPAGVSLKANGANVGPGCAPGPGVLAPTGDRAALTSCLTALKQRAASPEAIFSADAPTRFEVVYALLETLRGPEGTLFPDVHLAVAR